MMNNLLQAFNSVDAYVIAADTDGTIIFVNTTAERIASRDYTGHRIDDMLGEDTYREWQAAVSQNSGTLLQNADFFDRSCTLEIIPSSPSLLFYKPKTNTNPAAYDTLSIFSGIIRDALTDSFAATQFLQDAPQPKYLANLDRSLYRILRAINSATTIASYTSPDFECDFYEVSLAESVAEILRGVKIVFDALGINLVTKLDPLVVTMLDATVFEQALLSLLTNAAKHSPKGGTVTVSIWQDIVECYVGVTDEGESFSNLSGVFDLPRHDNYKRGLGLLLVGEAARLHGGSVTIKAASPKGKTVIMSLQNRSSARIVKQKKLKVVEFDPILVAMSELLDSQTFAELKKNF